ncbi:MAG TPA: TadE/TadG family type IV pilus assembly protein [Acidimicrobiales bacterium]|nr:TadE/TadG family type IV pilus assembly protein [Acidimicrobiales bacterium]
MVELALVLPLLAAFLLGTFTGGAAYFQKISLVDAAREGARYGASLQNDVTTGGLATWRLNVQNRVVQLAGGQLAAADVCVDLVTPTGSNTVCGVDDPPGAASDPTVLAPTRLVKVSATSAAHVQFFFFTVTPTLSAEVVARYEREII